MNGSGCLQVDIELVSRADGFPAASPGASMAVDARLQRCLPQGLASPDRSSDGVR